MNPISLPVRVDLNAGPDNFPALDANRELAFVAPTEAKARQITIALNLHDELVATLKLALAEIKDVHGSARLYNCGMEVLLKANP